MVAERLERLKSRLSAASWGSARWQQALTAIAAAALCYAIPAYDPSVGLDPSWESALAMARTHHLNWGPQIVFTAGPLGFLHTPTFYYLTQSAFATVYQLVVLGALFLGIATVLRQRCSPPISLVGGFAATVAANFFIASLYPDLAVFASFAWASVLLLHQEPRRSTVFIICVALGAVAGFQFLVKINSGPTVLVIALATSVLLDWRAVGRHLATVATFVASTVLCWFLAGQPLAALPVWLRRSGAIASGYVDAMAVPLPWIAIPALLLTVGWVAVVCVMFVRGSPEIPRRFVLLVGLVSVLVAKTAFGRFDPGHIFILLALIVVATVIVPPSRVRRRSGVLVAVALVYLSVAGPVAYRQPVAVALSPVHAVERLVTLALPGQWNEHVKQSRATQRASYAVPAKFVATIGSASVHIDPHEASAAWAYDFSWLPTPVFQTYSAYAPELDEANRDTLARGPQYVLSHESPGRPAAGIDGRLAVQESPLYSRALLCDYTVSGVENHWALFARSRPHCGAPTTLSETNVHNNEVITIPPASGPNKAVLVSIELTENIFDKLFQGTVVPLTSFTVTLDQNSYRLVTANAAEPFLVVAPSSVDGTNWAIHAHTIGVSRRTSFGSMNAAARLRFYEMAVG